MGDPADWAREMTEAGADGLALRADPGDPVAVDLLAALREVSPLPIEVQPPEALPVAPAWASGLAAAGADWLLPGRIPSEEAERALAQAGIAWAWPVSAGPAPAGTRRLHARGTAGPGVWDRGPAGAERSLAPEPEGELPDLADSGADTLILPGAALMAADPAASLAERRG